MSRFYEKVEKSEVICDNIIDMLKFTNERRLRKLKKNEKIVFENYGIEFSEKDFKDVDIDTLVELKKRVRNIIKELENVE